VKTVKESKKQILYHKIEPNPLKDRAMHGGDNPLITELILEIKIVEESKESNESNNAF
jgi:hypothetical protein